MSQSKARTSEVSRRGPSFCFTSYVTLDVVPTPSPLAYVQRRVLGDSTEFIVSPVDKGQSPPCVF